MVAPKYLNLRCLFILGISLHGIAAWNPAMIGGMKLGFDGDIYSFTLDVCPGGVFFKEAIHIPLQCTHGYFLKRPNGCKMEDSDIIGGLNYACNRIGKDTSVLTQALIPLTNPEYPTQHTITFFDDMDTLKNFRRYTYVKGLEGEYEGSDEGAIAVVVANSHKTPQISIGNMCYEGKSRTSAAAYMATLKANSVKGASNQFFVQKCSDDSYQFPWSSATRYPVTTAFSAPQIFHNEIKARLSKTSKERSGLEDFEIWNGLAYCLQEKQEMINEKVKPVGLYPKLDGELEPMCGKKSAGFKHDLEAGNSFFRRKRRVQPMRCVECCGYNYMPNNTNTKA
ncbi:unnamed protein product [Allacma fusca]|uniref:Uncharacterized protein n=1 Tax=Allacma fusca TaxID=39272 RepID=A0A8J2JPE2_9HEXA|nr:unnamed protein product [Allacma fusca]